jgi:hypothetical protein
MSRKHRQSRLEEIVRSQGAPQPPRVDVLASEVRSCLVAACPPDLPPGNPDLLGGVVVIWEFTLQLTEVEAFHDFLRKQERYIAESLSKLDPDATYRGTYMQYAPGDPSYRTVWAYKSLETMCHVWEKAHKSKTSNFYKAAAQLRSYWLRDPDRREARWVPGRLYFDPEHDIGDGFAKLTLEAVKLLARRKR